MISHNPAKKNMSRTITKEDFLDFLRAIEMNHPGSDLSKSAGILADSIDKDENGNYSSAFKTYNALYNPGYTMLNDMQLPLIELTGDQYKVISIMINAMSEDNMLCIDNTIHYKIYGFKKESELTENLKVLCDLGYIAEVPRNYLKENFGLLESIECDRTIYMVAPFISCQCNDRKFELANIFSDLTGKEKINRITDKIFERNYMVSELMTCKAHINYQMPPLKIN